MSQENPLNDRDKLILDMFYYTRRVFGFENVYTIEGKKSEYNLFMVIINENKTLRETYEYYLSKKFTKRYITRSLHLDGSKEGAFTVFYSRCL